MDCSCIYVGDYDDTETIHEKRLKAKKSHTCDECCNGIVPGTTYERYVGKFNGKVETHRTCSTCLDLRITFFCAGWIWGGLYEALWEHISEMDGQISSECLLSLTPAARDVVIGMIDDYFKDTDDLEDA